MSGRRESLRRASKRAEREVVATLAALRNEHSSRALFPGKGSDDLHNDLPDSSLTDEPQNSKKKRGPTRCMIMESEGDSKVEVKFNERGQAIEAGSVKLSSFLGVLVRETIPITYTDWRRVPEDKKDFMWELVKQNFILDGEQHKIYTLQIMGKLWRAYKSRLTATLDACEDEDEIEAIKPHNLDSTQWENFISLRSTPEYREKRAKFKEMRLKQVLRHTCSRKGYARLEDEMRKESEKPSSISRVDVWSRGHTKKNGEPSNPIVAEHLEKLQEIRQTSSATSPTTLKGDALAQLLGPERRGRVRGVGFGIPHSKLGVDTQSTSKIARLEEELSTIKEKFSNMEKMMMILINNQADKSTSEHQGVKCKLFRMVEDDIVAEGRWVTDDPDTAVHHVPLGPGASKVWVDRAVEPRAWLWRTSNGMERMEDVVGSTIAWPTDKIIKECI